MSSLESGGCSGALAWGGDGFGSLTGAFGIPSLFGSSLMMAGAAGRFSDSSSESGADGSSGGEATGDACSDFSGDLISDGGSGSDTASSSSSSCGWSCDQLPTSRSSSGVTAALKLSTVFFEAVWFAISLNDRLKMDVANPQTSLKLDSGSFMRLYDFSDVSLRANLSFSISSSSPRAYVSISFAFRCNWLFRISSAAYSLHRYATVGWTAVNSVERLINGAMSFKSGGSDMIDKFN
ncbi:hypothetical protein OGAPHI_006653 [Ogataea philodendri]|uniref:Uncharacterized protein n=1 Tax=Ogataea philodendri TaxID=1378263 RepID=A0A9P8T0B1_9ASCO|nr:uncharacterized protein OGAPHI_006653 [Ogataea philodendri]KAH3661246.1 hypothetical protein OGAPHI_006653 [Ogataea philodendri]